MGKRKILIFILLLFFGFQMQTNAQSTQNQSLPLLSIIRVMHEHEVSVKHWGLYTKKIGGFIQDRKGYVRLVEGLKSDLPNFHWTEMTKDYEGNLKVTGIHTDNKTNVHERLTFLAFRKGDHWRTYMIYAAGSDQWDPNKWKTFSSTFYDRIHHYFGETPTIFTCVSGSADATMNLVLLQRAQKLLQSFSAVPVEKLQEKTFVSVSAYNGEWKRSIQTRHHHKMNLQVALRTVGDSTTVTIGTPIITTEY
ncbi:MAG TPA: YwmB family TATA-box binding protein [Bacillales bacterium]|nr:YwmB family TATA-box binding protein [Bacillales bacterium]